MSLPLVGRDRERALLVGSLDRLCDDEGGSVLVIAAAGMGKSTLLADATAEAVRRQVAVLSGSARPEQRFRAFGLIAEAFGPGVLDGGGTLGGHPPPGTTQAAGSGQYVVQESFLDHVSRRAMQGPLLVVLDDVHWADSASRRLLGEALSRMVAERVLWVLASRPPDSADPNRLSDAPKPIVDQARPLSTAQTVELRPLNRDAVTVLATVHLGASPGPRLQGLLDRSNGSPLYVTELCRSLRAEGWLQRSAVGTDGRATVELAPDTPLPQGFRSLVAHGIDQLPALTRRTLQMAAVLGTTSSVTDLAQMASTTTDDIGRVLSPAVAGRLVDVTEGEVRFAHDLVREALYESLPLSVRMAAHSDVARRLSDVNDRRDLLAWHHLFSRLPEPDRPWPSGAPPTAGPDAEPERVLALMSSRAAETAAVAPDTAAEMLRAALTTVAPDGPLAHRLLLDEAWAETAAGAIEAGERTARAIIAGPHDPSLDAEMLELLAESLTLQRRYAEAVEPLGQAISVASHPDDRARLRVSRAFSLGLAGMFDAGLAEGEEVYKDSGAPQESRGRAATLLALAHCVRGHPTHAVELGVEAVDAARSIPFDLRARTLHHYVLGLSLMNADRWDEADDAVLQGIRAAEARGYLVDLPLHLSARAVLLLLRGMWSDAVAEAETGLEVSRSLGSLRNVAILHDVIAAVALGRGDRVAASEAIMAAERVAPIPVTLIPPSRLSQTKAALAEGPEEALAVLRASWDVAMYADAGSQLLALGPALIRASIEVGEESLPRSVNRQVARAAHRFATPYAAGVVEHCRGLALSDCALLQQAVAHLRRSPRRLHLAEALLDLAAASARTRKRALARDAADEALTILRDVRADSFAAEAEAVLASLGEQRYTIRPRRATSGWGSLTRTERCVVQLVAEGMSNRQIAESLVVSHRTVETHVSHSLTKLGERSRVGLVKAALAAAAAEGATRRR